MGNYGSWRIKGVNGEYDEAGYSVAGIGDINGDGIDDLAVTAKYGQSYTYGGFYGGGYTTETGTVYVVFGTDDADLALDLSAIDGSNGFVINPDANLYDGQWTTTFGVSVSALGDVNGDGLDDFGIVQNGTQYGYDSYGGGYYGYYGYYTATAFAAATFGTPTSSSGEGYSSGKMGIAYVIFGTEDINDGNSEVMVTDLDHFRMDSYDEISRIVSLGDVNGDGFDDIGVDVMRNSYKSGQITSYYLYDVNGNGYYDEGYSNGYAYERSWQNYYDINVKQVSHYLVYGSDTVPDGSPVADSGNSQNFFDIYSYGYGDVEYLGYSEFVTESFEYGNYGYIEATRFGHTGGFDLNGDGFDDVAVSQGGVDVYDYARHVETYDGSYSYQQPPAISWYGSPTIFDGASGSSFSVWGVYPSLNDMAGLGNFSGGDLAEEIAFLDGYVSQTELATMGATESSYVSGAYVLNGRSDIFDSGNISFGTQAVGDGDGAFFYGADFVDVEVNGNTYTYGRFNVEKLLGPGDVTGDGIDDMILVGERYIYGQPWETLVYVISGSSTAMTGAFNIDDMVASGDAYRISMPHLISYSEFGSEDQRHWTGLGDLNGDGANDFGYGNPYAEDEDGEAFVIFGGAALAAADAADGTADGKILSENLIVDVDTGEVPIIINIDQDTTVWVTEGDTGTATMTFEVTRTGNLTEEVSFDWAVQGVTADAADFDGSVLPSGTVTFASGSATAVIEVEVAGDYSSEASPETFTVGLSNGSATSGATVAIEGQSATGYIYDDDIPMQFYLGTGSVTEGDPGDGQVLRFSITRYNSIDEGATIQWSIAPYSTASLTAEPEDFEGGLPQSGSATFAAGVSTVFVDLPILEDQLVEGNEYITATIYNAVSDNPLVDTQIITEQRVLTIIEDDLPMTYSVNDPTVTETDGTDVALTFTITRTGETTVAGSVDFELQHYTSESEDFTSGFIDPITGLPRSGTLDFAAGETTKQITLMVAGDNLYEGTEYVRLNLDNAVNSTGDQAVIADNLGYGYIYDDDNPAIFSVYSSSVTEGDTGTRSVTFTVNRSGNTAIEASVEYDMTPYFGSNAVDNDDFASGFPQNGTLTFAAGITTMTVTAQVQGDTLIEADEYLQLLLSNPVSDDSNDAPILSNALSIATIWNDDQPVRFGIYNSSVTEGDSGSSTIGFTVYRSGNTSVAATVDYDVEPYFGSNTADASDFTSTFPTSGTVSFAAGQTSKTITMQVSGDLDVEPTEYFQVLLSNADAGSNAAQVDRATAIGTISNDDVPVNFYVTNASTTEGSGDLRFFIYRTGETEVAASVDWTFAGHSTRPLSGADLDSGLPQGGTVEFAAGETRKTIVIDVSDDAIYENTEYGRFTLSNAQTDFVLGAEITGATANGTVYDDEVPVYLSISNGFTTERDPGETSTLVFYVYRSGDTSVEVSADVSITSGTAGSGDVVGTLPYNTSVTFAANETTKLVSIDIAGDNIYENTEYLRATLSNASTPASGVQLNITAASANGYIYDDDTPVYFKAYGYSTVEGDPGDSNLLTFSVVRSGDLTVAATVDYNISGGTTNAADFSSAWPTSGTLSFAAGETVKTITLDIAADDEIENNEYTYVSLSNPVNSNGDGSAFVTGARAYSTILTDDYAARITMSTQVSTTEGDPGDANALSFTIYRSGDTQSAVTMDYQLAADSYTPANSADFEGGLPQSGQVTFAAGETSKTLSFAIAEDLDVEGNERVRLNLSNASASGSSGQVRVDNPVAVGTIYNDDVAPRLTMYVNGSTWGTSVNEGNSGTTYVTVTFLREGSTDGVLDVEYNLLNTIGSVFSPDSNDVVGFMPSFGNTVTFDDGVAQVTATIGINGDGIIEANETFTVKIVNVESSVNTAYDVWNSSATVTINNDDGRPPLPELPFDVDGDGEIEPGEVIRVEADIFGDPHITTLDGLGYDFQAVGEYVLVETEAGATNPFSVQVRFEAFPGSDVVSVCTRMAVEVAGSIVEIDALNPSQPLLIDGVAPTAAQLALGAIDLDEDGVADVFIEDGKYFITLNEANETVMVGLLDDALNVCVFLGDPALGGNAGAVQGLMGNANQDPTDDFGMRDGSGIPVDQISYDGEGNPSLTFDFLYGVGAFAGGGYKGSWALEEGEANFSGDTPDFPADFPAGPLTLDALPEDVVNAAIEAARAAGVDESNPIIFDAAVLDFALTGMGAFLNGATQLAGDPEVEAQATDGPSIGATVLVSAESLSITEGDSDLTEVSFTFYRTETTSGDLTIQYELGGEVDAADFAAGTPDFAQVQEIVIPDGEDSATVTFQVQGDLDTESDETFTVDILSVDTPDVSIAGSHAETEILTDDFPPEAQDDRFAMDADETLTGNVFEDNGNGEDSDPDGDPLTVTDFTFASTTYSVPLLGDTFDLGSGASLYVDGDGNFVLTPGDLFGTLADGQVEEFTLDYTVEDGNGGSDTAQVLLSVTGTAAANAAPVARADTYTLNEDTPFEALTVAGVLANDEDTDGDSLTVTLLSDVTNGTLSLNSDGSFSYLGNQDFNGTDSFTYAIDDGNGGTDTATVTLNVLPVNDAPVAYPSSVSMDEDVAKAFGISGLVSDVDGDSLSFSSLSVSAGASIQQNGDLGFVITPDANFNGTLTVTYKVTDGTSESTEEEIEVTVNPVNDDPTTVADLIFVDEDTPFVGDVRPNVSDVDGDSLTFSLSETPTFGQVTFNTDGTYTYVPPLNYSGSDQFSYLVEDGNGGEATGVITIAVQDVNDPPVAVSDVYSTAFGTPLIVGAADGFLANDTDVDGDELTVDLVSGFDPATEGTLNWNSDGSFEFTPLAGFSGAVTFTYSVLDPDFDSDTGSVTINVGERPATEYDIGDITVDEGGIATFTITRLNNLDIESQTLTVNFADGSATVASDYVDSPFPPFNFTAGQSEMTVSTNTIDDLDVEGSETFFLELRDAGTNALLADGTATIIDDDVENSDPVADDPSLTTNEDTPLTGTLVDHASDVDGDTLTFAAVGTAANGTFSVNPDGSYTYTPDENWFGTETVMFSVEDGKGGSDTGTMTIEVTPVNDEPVANDDAYSVTANNTLTIDAASGLLANDSDVDGDTLTSSVQALPQHGTVTVNSDGSFEYVPDTDYFGADQFSYLADDGNGGTQEAFVDITVGRPDTMYEISDPIVDEGEMALFIITRLNNLDIASEVLTLTLVSGTATAGADFDALMFAPYTFTIGQTQAFTPGPTFQDRLIEGDETFHLELREQATDQLLATGTATITDDDVNGAPVAGDFTVYVDEDDATTIEPTIYGTDPEGDELYIESYSGSVPGLLAPLPASWIFTPDADYNGTFTITYTLNDGVNVSNEATITVIVEPVNDTPMAVDDYASTTVDTAIMIDVLANDTDIDGDILELTGVTAITGGTVAIDDNGTPGDASDDTVVFTPGAGFIGTASFSYTISDGTEVSTAYVEVEVTAAGAGTVGTPGDDRMEGTPNADTLSGLAGDDLILGRESGDDLSGGEDDDTIRGEAGDDTIDGGAGGDKVQGGDDNDLLDGGADDDRIYGDAGNDTVIGGDGDDVLYGDKPNSSFGGYLGTDIFAFDDDDGMDRVFDFAPDVDKIRLDSGGTATFEYNAARGDTVMTYGSTVVTFFDVQVDDADIFTTGGNKAPLAVADEAQTNVGEAVVIDVMANDSDPEGDVFGIWSVTTASHGTVTINSNGTPGIPGDDFLTYTPDAGYVGNDSFTYEVRDEFGNISAGLVTVDVGVGSIPGTTGDDRLIGTDGREVIDAMDGNDTVKAGEGNDTVTGGIGNDKILGEGGNDSLDGGADDDRVYGGLGNDTIRGGMGDDVLYGDLADRTKGALGEDTFVFGLDDGDDRVFDFVSGLDKVHLEGLASYTLTDDGDDTTLAFGSTTITFFDSLLTADDIFMIL